MREIRVKLRELQNKPGLPDAQHWAAVNEILQMVDEAEAALSSETVNKGECPWCEACRSYHHPDDTTCKAKAAEVESETPSPGDNEDPCPRCGGDQFINIHENLPDEPCPECNADAPSGAERVRAMATRDHAQEAPASWKIVPIHPTEEMRDAAVKGSRADVSYADIDELWPAMLKAVPAAITTSANARRIAISEAIVVIEAIRVRMATNLKDAQDRCDALHEANQALREMLKVAP